MAELVEIWERPQTENLYMIAGWRQWADAGSVSSGLPQYLIRRLDAQPIGEMHDDGYYLFQIPGTHDLVRPVVKFEDGYPRQLEARTNELYYVGDEKRGVVIFIGDEPHLNMERYTDALLGAAESLGVKRIVVLGGVYGELPYDKERAVGGMYSLLRLKPEMNEMAVEYSNYHGGASIGSYLCKRAGERNIELVGFYAYVPTYDFSAMTQRGSTLRIENDYMAWLGVMRRINYMFKTRFSLADLERKSDQLLREMETRLDELDGTAPQVGVRDYMRRLSESFTERPFDPLDDVWTDALRNLLDDDASTDDER